MLYQLLRILLTLLLRRREKMLLIQIVFNVNKATHVRGAIWSSTITRIVIGPDRLCRCDLCVCHSAVVATFIRVVLELIRVVWSWWSLLKSQTSCVLMLVLAGVQPQVARHGELRADLEAAGIVTTGRHRICVLLMVATQRS